MYGINYDGLRKRESYDDLVRYIETDPTKIKYPQRTASFIEQSHYMKHLGGEDYMAMEEQQLRASKEKVKEDIIREMAGGEGTSSLIREELRREAPPPTARDPTPEAAPVVVTEGRRYRRAQRRSQTPEATQEEAVAPTVVEDVNRVVEEAKDKKAGRRSRNQQMVIEQLANTTRIPEAGRTADVKMQPRATPIKEQQVRGQSPVIQIVDDAVMEPSGVEEVRYTKAAMRRMRKKGAFPEPYGNPSAYSPNQNPASSNDPSGSSASADYQRRLREEELLRLERERLVSKQLQEDKKEATRGRSKTVKKKKEKEMEAEEENAPDSKGEKSVEVVVETKSDDRERSRSKQGKRRGKDKEPEAEKPKAKRQTSDDTSKKPKKSKVEQLTLPEQKEARKRQQEEQKAEEKQEKRRKPTAKEEGKTQYFQISDVEQPKAKKKAEEPKKEEAEQAEERGRAQHGTKIDTKKTKSYWEKKSNAYIIDQLSLHGVRIDPSLITGKKVEIDPALDRKVTTKVKKITKAELLNMLYKALKVS